MEAVPANGSSLLLEAVLNLSLYHRAHEEFYASEPREMAVGLQRHSRTLHALADRWAVVDASTRAVLSPFEGAEDLTDPAALQLDGVLFMEGEARPPELDRLVRDLRSVADDLGATGDWLANAMQASWDVAASLVEIDELADALGERHRIIANDWQAAGESALAARILRRAADMVDRLDLEPAAVRRDLDGPHVLSRRLHSAAELIDHAADLCSHSAGLVHDNERRWRVFRRAVAVVVEGSAD